MKNIPAFPLNTPKWHESVSDAGWSDNNDFTMGMILRDYFAAKAMQGFLATVKVNCPDDLIAGDAYALADAMMKAREK